MPALWILVHVSACRAAWPAGFMRNVRDLAHRTLCIVGVAGDHPSSARFAWYDCLLCGGPSQVFAVYCHGPLASCAVWVTFGGDGYLARYLAGHVYSTDLFWCISGLAQRF